MRTTKSTDHAMLLATYGLRLLVVVLVIAAAATFLHVNNYRPKQIFLSCDRPCHHLDWPMICRVKLTLEVFQSLSKSCGDCPQNETACFADHCVSTDGHRRGILTANRQLPGPTIQFIFSANSRLVWRLFSFKSDLRRSSSNSEGLPLRDESSTLKSPFFNFANHFRSVDSPVTPSPYTSQMSRAASAAF